LLNFLEFGLVCFLFPVDIHKISMNSYFFFFLIRYFICMYSIELRHISCPHRTHE
jgi:hypothetical protein